MWQFGMAPRCYMTAVNEAWVTDCMTPKPQDPRIYRSYSAQICAPSCPSRVEKKKCLRSLFCKFKTLVSFPEAVAFAWLDQADLGLSRRPRPSPLDGSSLLTQSAAPEAQRRGALQSLGRISTPIPEEHDKAQRRRFCAPDEQRKVLPLFMYLFICVLV